MGRNKILYLFGAGISDFGDGIQQIALYWYMYHMTGNALSIGIMIAIYYLPSILLTPFLSVIVDFYDSKKITVLTDLSRGAVVLAMAVCLYLQISELYLIYLFQFMIAVFYTIYKPASQSFIKQSFEKKDLPFIISRSNSVNQTLYIIGTGLSGALISIFPIYLFFIVNAISFCGAALLYRHVQRLADIAPKQRGHGYWNGLKEGFLYVNREQGMKYLLFLSIINSIGIQLAMTIMLPFAVSLGGGSRLYSFMEIAFTVGGILAGLRMNTLIKKQKETIVLYTMGGMCLTSLLIGFTGNFTFTIILVFLFGLFTMGHLIAAQTFIQIKTSSDMIGRVTGVRTILASLVKISSSLATGSLVAAAGPHTIFLMFCGILVLVLLFSGRLKKLELGSV
ncbi:MFS transporter [Peribacillus kribbensis]|uniref:MFS transporter n=1 Tax=Peribacillus kribbensis TaxID=356658 RepID=UPI0004065790|nr:MFS transporter [Peribacillus kribbensis]